MNTHPVASRVEPARDATSTRADSLTRALGIIALVGVAFITVTCLLVQFLRTDLSWTATSMSIYVKGPYGRWVQASFFAPAPGIAALGIGWYRALDRRAQRVSTGPVRGRGRRVVRHRILHRRRHALARHRARQDSSMGRVRHLHLRDHRRAAAIVAPALRSRLARAIH